MKRLTATVSQLLANTLYQEASKGGATLNTDFETPKEGFMVSIVDGPVFDSLSDVNPLAVGAFIKKALTDPIEDHTTDHNLFFGVWVDTKTGKVYFDQSLKYNKKEIAIENAKFRNQIAIWDVKGNKEIRL